MILKCAITDDEPLALDLLESYVMKTPSLQLCGKYHSAVEAMSGLKETPVDLLFLDIQMPELDGLEFSRMVPAYTRVVFTTAFGQYALDGYKVNALDYLLKPVSYQEFMRVVNKALDWFSHTGNSLDTAAGSSVQAPDSIFIKSEYKLMQIHLDDILYIEGLKDYVKIYLRDKEFPVLSLMSMRTMEEILPHGRFMRVHRSYIVNTSRIGLIDRGRIVFGNTYIPVGESYRQAFQAFLDSRLKF